jgi:hypothetical protein
MEATCSGAKTIPDASHCPLLRQFRSEALKAPERTQLHVQLIASRRIPQPLSSILRSRGHAPGRDRTQISSSAPGGSARLPGQCWGHIPTVRADQAGLHDWP